MVILNLISWAVKMNHHSSQLAVRAVLGREDQQRKSTRLSGCRVKSGITVTAQA